MSQDKAFRTGWSVVKGEDEVPIDECKGCGLAHGSPNSAYCSEICERQNKLAKAPMYRGDECVHCEETIGGKSGNVAYECSDTGNAFCKGCYKHRKNYR